MSKLKYFLLSVFLVISFLIGYAKFNNMNINDLGLKVMSWIKTAKGGAVDLTVLKTEQPNLIDHSPWTTLLQKYVTESGKVNYSGFIQEKAELEQYLAQLSQTPPGTNWKEGEQLAYWINTYNAFTVKLIIDNYPTRSIKDIAEGLPIINSPWDIKFFKIGKTDFDLSTIEHEILRKKFDEPRIHFAINCASFSCPRLRNEAFEPSKLEEQLEDQTKFFINNLDKNKIDQKTTSLSSIFNWFESDFTKKEPIKDFIKRYHSDFNESKELTYMPYNWNLNE